LLQQSSHILIFHSINTLFSLLSIYKKFYTQKVYKSIDFTDLTGVIPSRTFRSGYAVLDKRFLAIAVVFEIQSFDIENES